MKGIFIWIGLLVCLIAVLEFSNNTTKKQKGTFFNRIFLIIVVIVVIGLAVRSCDNPLEKPFDRESSPDSE
jgi:hypothetical protein